MTLTMTAEHTEQPLGNMKMAIGTMKFDSSYPTGGESIAAALARVGLNQAYFMTIEPNSGYSFVLDQDNQKVLAYKGLIVDQAIGIVKDDNDAETNGTDIYVHVDEVLETTCLGHLESVNAGNADSLLAIGEGGPTVTIRDDNDAATASSALYADTTEAVGGDRLQSAVTNGLDCYIPLSDGRFLKIVYAASPAGVTVHFDDNATDNWERMLSVVVANADGTFLSDDTVSLNMALARAKQVPNTTDLSALTAVRFMAFGI